MTALRDKSARERRDAIEALTILCALIAIAVLYAIGVKP